MLYDYHHKNSKYQLFNIYYYSIYELQFLHINGIYDLKLKKNIFFIQRFSKRISFIKKNNILEIYLIIPIPQSFLSHSYLDHTHILLSCQYQVLYTFANFEVLTNQYYVHRY